MSYIFSFLTLNSYLKIEERPNSVRVWWLFACGLQGVWGLRFEVWGLRSAVKTSQPTSQRYTRFAFWSLLLALTLLAGTPKLHLVSFSKSCFFYRRVRFLLSASHIFFTFFTSLSCLSERNAQLPLGFRLALLISFLWALI